MIVMQFTSQDLSDILQFPFKDKQWFSKLCLQGALLLFLSFFFIGIPFLNGFMARLLDQSIKGETTLPGWSEWGTYWRLGWKSLVVNFLYMLPAVGIWFVLVMGMMMLQFLSLADKNLELLPLLFLPVIFFAYGCMFLYTFAMQFVQAAYLPVIAQDAPMTAAFDLKGYVWPYIKQNALAIFIGFLIIYIASLIASVGMFALFIGYFFTLPYAFGVMAQVHGLIYRRSTIKYIPTLKA